MLLHESENLCSDTAPIAAVEVAIVRRGACAFETKARIAHAAGYRALIILNLDNEEPFPAGSSDPAFVSSIPVLMAHSELADQLKPLSDGQMRLYFERVVPAALPSDTIDTNTNKQKNSADRKQNEAFIALMSRLAMPVLVAVVVVAIRLGTATGPPTTPWPQLLSYALIMLTAISLRMCTFRVLLDGPDTPLVYNHKETDERIFAALIRSITLDPYDYTLAGKPIVEALNLSRENYSDPLFIHPPLFVYLSAWLVSLGISLPTIPILCNAVVIILLPIFIKQAGLADLNLLPSAQTSNHVELIALLIYCTCPLSHFCSQKFWIDNLLCSMVLLSATIHVVLCRSDVMGTLHDTWARARSLAARNFFSGVCFGALVLQCKLTGLASLPFLMGWSSLMVLESEEKGRLAADAHDANVHGVANCSGKKVRKVVTRGTRKRSPIRRASAISSSPAPSPTRHAQSIALLIAMSWVPLLVGSFISFAPWLYAYRVYAGRWIPNAWPSKAMIARSPFLQAATTRPIWYYAEVIVTYMPLQAIGIGAGIGFVVFAGIDRLLANVSKWRGNSSIDYSLSASAQASSISIAKIAILLVYPLAYVVSLTLLGSAGAGYQSRFILSTVPASCTLGAIAITQGISACRSTHSGQSNYSSIIICVSALLTIISIMHCFFYGVLYAPLFADLDISMWRVMTKILQSPYRPPASQSSMEETAGFARHFGVPV